MQDTALTAPLFTHFRAVSIGTGELLRQSAGQESGILSQGSSNTDCLADLKLKKLE